MVLSNVQRIQRRAKQAERDAGKWLLEHDGIEPMWKAIASSTGRVGMIYDLQFDVVSNHYCGEVKNIKMSLKLLNFWQQIQDVAADHGKNALLIIEPSNPLPRRVGIPRRSNIWHVITEARHEELLAKERIADGL